MWISNILKNFRENLLKVRKRSSESWVGSAITLKKEKKTVPSSMESTALVKEKGWWGISAHVSFRKWSVCKTRTWSRWLISPLYSRTQCLLICLSCLWQPWRLITFCGSLLWVVIWTSRSASHMFFDYWRWRARTLSAHCVALSEVDTRVKAHKPKPDTC